MKLSFYKLGKFFPPLVYALPERANSDCDACGLLCDSCLHVNIVGWHRYPSGWDEVEVTLRGGEACPGQARLVGQGEDWQGAWPGVRSSSLMGAGESLERSRVAEKGG